LGEQGSYTHAAEVAGLDYTALVNRLVAVASARYFGTPHPPQIPVKTDDPGKFTFSYITQRRDAIEKRLKEWISLSSRTSDPVGLREARTKFETVLTQMGLSRVDDLSNEHSAWTWATKKGLENGTLLVCHLDVPLSAESPPEVYRRDPEWLYGEGVGSSRAPVVMLEFALQSLRAQRQLRKRRIGVLFYTDEGRDALYSENVIQRAAAKAKQVIVLRPGRVGNQILTQRRGQRKYELTVDGTPRRIGQVRTQPEPLLWFSEKLAAITKLSSRKQRLAVAAVDVRSENFPKLTPHRVKSTLLMSYLDGRKADDLEKKIRTILGKRLLRWRLEIVSDRPSMKDRVVNRPLVKALLATASEWEIELDKGSSLWPSVAGLVAGKTAVVCGVGPVGRDLYTPREAIQRISMVQRAIVLAQFLLKIETR
jgi:D-alanine-D-alanine ligase